MTTWTWHDTAWYGRIAKLKAERKPDVITQCCCSKVIRARPWSPRRYCSYSCSNRYRNITIWAGDIFIAFKEIPVKEKRELLVMPVRKGLKGVSRDGFRWCARIRTSGKQVYLGYFDTEEEAAEVYRVALADFKQGRRDIKKPPRATLKL